jgi:hypothetical protein
VLHHQRQDHVAGFQTGNRDGSTPKSTVYVPIWWSSVQKNVLVSGPDSHGHGSSHLRGVPHRPCERFHHLRVRLRRVHDHAGRWQHGGKHSFRHSCASQLEPGALRLEAEYHHPNKHRRRAASLRGTTAYDYDAVRLQTFWDSLRLCGVATHAAVHRL